MNTYSKWLNYQNNMHIPSALADYWFNLDLTKAMYKVGRKCLIVNKASAYHRPIHKRVRLYYTPYFTCRTCGYRVSEASRGKVYCIFCYPVRWGEFSRKELDRPYYTHETRPKGYEGYLSVKRSELGDYFYCSKGMINHG